MPNWCSASYAIAVSYTHLDVYKRQAWMHSICQTVHLLM